VTNDLSSADFPIGKSPTHKVLTVDHRGSGFGVSIAREVHTRFANPRNPISRLAKGDRREETVGKELPRELEEL
jgi:hypothetical protein